LSAVEIAKDEGYELGHRAGVHRAVRRPAWPRTLGYLPRPGARR
jgi:hypothetical protein